jgi:hypothetical protein
LPDYQGLGIGYKFVELIAEMYNEIDCPFYIKTSHTPFVKKFEKSKKWVVKKSDQREFNGNGYEHWKRRTNNCFTMRYENKKTGINTELITFNKDVWKDVSQHQISLF